MSEFVVKLFILIDKLLQRPKKVAIICISLALSSLILEGSLYQFWSLYKDQKSLIAKIDKINIKSESLANKIKKVSDPNYLEIEVRNQFDYVEEGDLIFMFSNPK